MRVCFIGHRSLGDATQLKIKLTETVSMLISDGVDTFLFGSRSEFDTLCWQVVTELKERYNNLKRICYKTPHETAFTSKDERKHYELLLSKILKRDVHFTDYEEVIIPQKTQKANKNSYIMRNLEMINNSDICVFYYNKNYLPPKRKLSMKGVAKQPQSGTGLVFSYATKQKKYIINLYTN